MHVGFPLPFLTSADELAEIVKSLVEGAAMGAANLRSRLPFPQLYDSGVVYKVEDSPDEIEEFTFPWVTLARGYGDCDDLCIWRLADLYTAGERARCTVQYRGSELHVQIRRADGSIEDPSEILGMP
jgi:hypothetical protein